MNRNNIQYQLITAVFLLNVAISMAEVPSVRYRVPLDSIILSDPAVLADKASQTYYMTGTGGMLWKSKDLKLWDGPFTLASPDTSSWMGPHPQIWAAELHEHNGKYYFFATFTNPQTIIENNKEGAIPRRASHILRSDTPEGPYLPFSDYDYLPSDRPTLDGTFWMEEGKPYMVFCEEWLHNQNGTVEALQLSDDLCRPVSKSEILFRASDSPWSREKRDGGVHFNRVTDGPWLFKTGTDRLGIIWTSWILGDYTMGVAYSDNGRLDGNWIQEPNPILPPNFGHGMIFTDFDGRTILSVHSHSEINGRYVRRPTFWIVDLTGDMLKIIKQINSSATHQ